MISIGWLASWLPMIQGATEQTVRKTRNVILITTDGLRCQELFTGAAAELMSKEVGGVENTNAFRKTFWRETPEARREALMPFFWSVVATQGQVFGNANKGSVVKVTAPGREKGALSNNPAAIKAQVSPPLFCGKKRVEIDMPISYRFCSRGASRVTDRPIDVKPFSGAAQPARTGLDNNVPISS